MDRRSFLKVLATVGVLTGTPTWLLDRDLAARFGLVTELPDIDVSRWLEPADLAVSVGHGGFLLDVSNESATDSARVELTLPLDTGAETLRTARR